MRAILSKNYNTSGYKSVKYWINWKWSTKLLAVCNKPFPTCCNYSNARLHAFDFEVSFEQAKFLYLCNYGFMECRYWNLLYGNFRSRCCPLHSIVEVSIYCKLEQITICDWKKETAQHNLPLTLRRSRAWVEQNHRKVYKTSVVLGIPEMRLDN